MGFGGEVDEDTVTEDGRGDGFDIFQRGHVGSAQCRTGLAAEDEILNGTRTGSPADIFLEPLGGVRRIGAGAANDFDGVVVNVIGHGDPADEALKLENFLTGQEGIQRCLVDTGGFTGDAFFFRSGRVIDVDEEHEAVELCFGKRVGSFLLDGVLRRKNEEGGIELVGSAKHGDVAFLHGLKHGRLGLGGRTVDFVGEDDVRKDGAFYEFELAFSAVAVVLNDVGSGDVGGHQVGCELNAVEVEMEGLGNAGNEKGFSEAGNTHEESVSAGEETDREFLDDFFLADDDLAEFSFEFLIFFPELIDGGYVVGWQGLASINRDGSRLGSCGFTGFGGCRGRG